MLIIGLTGSIAAGKSTVVEYLNQLNIPSFDADVEVHRLYDKGGDAVEAIGKIVPNAIKGGAVDRQVLAQEILGNRSLLKQVENIVHPLVQKSKRDFLNQARYRKEEIVVLDIPLLLEKRTPGFYDAIWVVTTTPRLQQIRALRRPGMTKTKLEAIRSKQLPEYLKIGLATDIIRTGLSKEYTYLQIRNLLKKLNEYPRPKRIRFLKLCHLN